MGDRLMLLSTIQPRHAFYIGGISPCKNTSKTSYPWRCPTETQSGKVIYIYHIYAINSSKMGE